MKSVVAYPLVPSNIEFTFTYIKKCSSPVGAAISFPSVSRLNLHRHVHKRQCLYNCFSPNCKKEYKWPQDLLCHLKSHLPTSHKCSQCEYSNPEKRLLVQHIRVYSNDLPFACRHCGTQFKHSMQCYHHETSLKHSATTNH